MRVAHRRALAQWTAISVAAAAAGAIVGRTRSGSEPLLVGVVALLTVLAHAAVTLARYSPRLARLTDQPVRVLVDDGRLCRRQLLACGLTEPDLFAQCAGSGSTTSPGCATWCTRRKAG